MPRVLLVDDDREVGRAIGRLLVHGGYDVTITGSGSEGLEKLGLGPWDLVLTDLYMPEVTGVDVARAASELEPKPALIIMTGTPDSELVPEAMGLLGQKLLEKPMSREELFEAVEAALAERNG